MRKIMEAVKEAIEDKNDKKGSEDSNPRPPSRVVQKC